MRLAQRRTRIRIKVNTPAEDELGGRSTELQTWGDRWAFVEPMGGRPAYVGGVPNASVSHKITIRYEPEVRAAWWVELLNMGTPEDAQLRIVSVENPKGAKHDTVLMCESIRDGSGDR